jgi:hypothetical protein
MLVGEIFPEEGSMEKKLSLDVKTVLVIGALILGLWGSGLWPGRDSTPAFGGNFAPQMAQQGGARFQIAGCDASSAWVIDTSVGDVFLIYSNGKWKEVASIMDDKKMIKK